MPPGYPSSYAWMATQKLATGYTDNLGRYSFTTTEGGNYFVRLVLHDANDVHMGAWYLPWDWSVDTETLSMVDTGLRYQLATESMNNKFRVLHSAIGRGG